jgi:hypothetical protein
MSATIKELHFQNADVSNCFVIFQKLLSNNWRHAFAASQRNCYQNQREPSGGILEIFADAAVDRDTICPYAKTTLDDLEKVS